MSTSVMAAVWPLQMPPPAKAVLVSLADNANDQGYAFPSISYICMRTCFKKTAVIEAIAWLEKAGFLKADRSNGRHTTYQITINADLFDSERPVRQTHRSATRTGTPHGPVRQTVEPVRQTDTNRQEPKAKRERETRAGEDLPEGIDPAKWEAFRSQLEHDGKLSLPRVHLALSQLRALAESGVDCNAILESAVLRGQRDLRATARELAAPPARAGPGDGRSRQAAAFDRLMGGKGSG